jgi:hypothetical protein
LSSQPKQQLAVSLLTQIFSILKSKKRFVPEKATKVA